MVQAATSANPLDPNATSWVGNICSGTKVGLQTALEKVNAKSERKVRELFDTGSQKSFITVRAVENVELRPGNKERLGIKAFQGKEFLLQPLRGGKRVKIECFLVDDVSSSINEHIELIKNMPI